MEYIIGAGIFFIGVITGMAAVLSTLDKVLKKVTNNKDDYGIL